MRLRHIEIFQAILQTGSVTGAASLLNISQPAATKALQHAEAQLGFSLFHRVRGKLQPTAEARILEGATIRVFEDLQAVRRLAVNLRGQEDQALRVMTTPTLAHTLLPKVIPAWHKRYPSTACELATHHTRELVESLLLHEADIGFSLQDPKHPGLRVQALAQGRMLVIAGQNYWSAEALQQPMTMEELSDLPLIGLDSRDALGGQLTHHLSEASAAPRIEIRVQTYHLARSLVEAGMGLAIVDPFTAYSGIDGALQVRELRPPIPVNLFALSRADGRLSASATWLLRQAASCAEGFVRLHRANLAGSNHAGKDSTGEIPRATKA